MNNHIYTATINFEIQAGKNQKREITGTLTAVDDSEAYYLAESEIAFDIQTGNIPAPMMTTGFTITDLKIARAQ